MKGVGGSQTRSGYILRFRPIARKLKKIDRQAKSDVPQDEIALRS